MKQLYTQILSLVNSSIHGTEYIPDTAIPWDDAYRLLFIGKLTGIVYPSVSKLSSPYCPDKGFLKVWRDSILQRGFRQLLSFQELNRILQEAQKRNLHPVVFKGLALSALYPEPNMRFSSDADILIPVNESCAMEQLLKDFGYSYMESFSKEHVPVYKIEEANRFLTVELHDCLWEDYTGPQADLLEQLELSAPDTLLRTVVCNIPITTLGYEQHLIYQIFHIAKHFAFEGLSLRYLTDISLYVNAYGHQIDFSHFWDAMKALKYDIFCDALFKICINYLGMDASHLSPEYEEYPVNETLLTDILTAGKEQGTAAETWAITNTMALYLMRSTKATRTPFSQKLHMLFPLPSELKDKFSYAKKYKILLPIAWIHRFLGAVSYSNYCKKNGTSPNDTYHKMVHRLQLMKDLKMVDFQKE